LYLPVGTPLGTNVFSTGINLDPVLLSVSPLIGSPAGSIITAIVKGAGPATTRLTLLATATWSDLCDTVHIPSYGVVVCKTKATAISWPTPLKVKLGEWATYACHGTCDFKTDPAKVTVTSAVVDAGLLTMTITGNNL